MKSVAVFGGTGSIGQLVVEKLSKSQTKVKVLTRKMPNAQMAENCEYFVGNVLDLNAVDNVVSKEDVVLITLGFNDSARDTMSRGTANIVNVMKSKGCDRIICLSAQGAGDSWDHMPSDFKEMVSKDEILSASFKDHGIQEDLIKNSDLDWTIVRPTEIVDSSMPGKVFTVNEYRDDLIFQISRQHVAEFICAVIQNNTYSKNVAMITC